RTHVPLSPARGTPIGPGPRAPAATRGPGAMHGDATARRPRFERGRRAVVSSFRGVFVPWRLRSVASSFRGVFVPSCRRVFVPSCRRPGNRRIPSSRPARWRFRTVRGGRGMGRSEMDAQEVARRLRAVCDELAERFYERADVVRTLMVTLLAGQHSLVLGPPGTAKSELARELTGRIEGAAYW